MRHFNNFKNQSFKSSAAHTVAAFSSCAQNFCHSKNDNASDAFFGTAFVAVPFFVLSVIGIFVYNFDLGIISAIKISLLLMCKISFNAAERVIPVESSIVRFN